MAKQSQFTQLQNILESLGSRLSELHGILLNERDALQQQQHDRIDQYAQQKETLTLNIEQLEQQRISVLASAQIENNESSFMCFVQSFGSTVSNKLTDIWDSIKQLSQQCHDQNKFNGIIINNLKRRTEQVLGILRGQSSQDIYDATGEKSASSSTHIIGQV